jgi:nuclear transport factor 2 (NTF2) superfamily protein
MSTTVREVEVQILDGGHFLRLYSRKRDGRTHTWVHGYDEGINLRRKIMGTTTTLTRPPFPPFTRDSAVQKVRLAEDAWNTQDPAKVALAYAIDSRWRNRSEFITGRSEIVAFLSLKWAKELDYRLIKELWAFTGNRIAVRFAYEWHDDSEHWYRSYGNENWEFSGDGLMVSRFASINDIPILESERKYHWVLGRRPDDHPGLSDLGL